MVFARSSAADATRINAVQPAFDRLTTKHVLRRRSWAARLPVRSFVVEDVVVFIVGVMRDERLVVLIECVVCRKDQGFCTE